MEPNTVLVTNDNIGFGHAIIPVLRILKAKGHTIITAAASNAPSLPLLKKESLEPIEIPHYPAWDCPDAIKSMKRLLDLHKPDCVLVGISDTKAGSEKTAVYVADTLGIPTVGLVEGWPHMWLAAYGDRDTPIYQPRVAKMCVMDTLSKVRLEEEGYRSDQLVVTGNPFNDILISSLAYRDEARDEVCMHFGIDPRALKFLYATTADLDNPDEEREGHPEWLGHSEESVLREFLNALQIAKKQYGEKEVEGIVRVKPHRKGVRVKELIAEICPSAHFDNVDYQGKPYPLLYADVVVGRYTLMLEHAALLQILAISCLPNLFDKKRQPIANQLNAVFAIYTKGYLAYHMKKIAKGRELAIEAMRSSLSKLNPEADATGAVVRVIEKYLT